MLQLYIADNFQITVISWKKTHPYITDFSNQGSRNKKQKNKSNTSSYYGKIFFFSGKQTPSEKTIPSDYKLH